MMTSANLGDVVISDDFFIQIVRFFKYLGDVVMGDGGDGEAVRTRISDAGKAFGSLRNCIFSASNVDKAAKSAVYITVVIAVLLYGCESWCLTEELLGRLRVFHAQCIRVMCRVTLKHTWEHHLSSQCLARRLGLDSIDILVTRRQLRWLGHVRRMGDERLPRRMLSSWVAHPRPIGAPKITYGRSVGKALTLFGVDQARWFEFAEDQVGWEKMLKVGFAPLVWRPMVVVQPTVVQRPVILPEPGF